jgi:hypothetical protein
MQTHPSRLLIFGLVLLFAVSARVHALSGDDAPQWRPITPAELQLKTPIVDPDADAEAIFWEIWLDDKKSTKMSYRHYVRVKIFTERGREKFSKMDIPFTKGHKVDDVAARVIKPDGSIIELQPGDIFDRELASAGKIKVQAKSFAVPGIEPGVIVEYQYTESIKDDSAGGERLVFQRDIPLEKVTYHVRPNKSASLQFHSYNMTDLKFVKENDGYSVATLTSVPAYKDEPYMPPPDEVRKWAYLHYSTFASALQWTMASVAWNEILQKFSKPNKEVKAKAEELTAGLHSEDDKVHKIYDFVQKNIKNLSYDKSMSDEQIEKLGIKDGDDALRRGMGRSGNIDMLFASLTRAAGLETAIVLAGDRSENFFTLEKYPFLSFVDWSAIAVKVDGQWRYFDPCGPFLPYGTLPWNREAVRAMLIWDNGHSWLTVPISEAAHSVARRKGKFELLPDGTLTGTVTLEYEGQQAVSRRRADFLDSDSKREQDIKDEIKENISAAEISDLSIQNFEDNTKPLTYSFKVRVPNYAPKVGKRMIFQPGFFEYGTQPLFSSAARTYDVYFPYPWSENDEIEIKLPAGMLLDSPEAPGEIADPKRIGVDRVRMAIDDKTNTLNYRREFLFGGGGFTLFPVSAYPAIKTMFDAFYKADTTSLSLKQIAIKE